METMSEDAELLRRYVENRSEEAFTGLVGRHLNLVYRAALRQANGDTHRAQDVTQAVFTLLARKAPSLLRHTGLSGWLYTTTHYAILEIARSERRRRDREGEACAMNELLSQPVSESNWSEVRPILDEVMQELGGRDREAVLLRFFEGCSFAEVGRKLAVGEDAARMRTTRALEKLGALFARRGITSSAAVLAAMLANEASVAAPMGLVAAVAGAALTSASGPTAGALTFLQLMSTTKVLLGAAVIAGLLAGSHSVYEYRMARGARADLAAAAKEYDASYAQLQELRKRSALAQRELADLKETTAGFRDKFQRSAADEGASKAAAASARANGKNSGPNRELSNDPRVRQALKESFNPMWASRYGLLFQSLGLSPSQIESMENLMSQRTSMSTQWGSISLQTDSVLPDQQDREERSILGDGGRQQLAQYESTAELREVASGLAGNLYNTDTPLTSQQAEQLTQILLNNSSRNPQGGDLSYHAVHWDTAVAQAQDILSAPQLSVFKNEVQLLSSGVDGLSTASPGTVGSSSRPPPEIFSAQSPDK